MTGPADGRTWYQVMGLLPSASASEIRSAYLRLARNLHPDRHASGSATERRLAERRMREVNAAWAVLGDASARSTYDTELRLAAARAAAPTARASAKQAPTTSPTARPVGSRPVHHRFDGVPLDDGEPDEVELTPAQFFLLRRVPVLVAIAIAIGIFIGTAYAGTRTDVPPTGQYVTTTTLGSSED